MDEDYAARQVEALYAEHHAAVRDYLYRLSKNSHLADDLTSETFERALRYLRQHHRDVPLLNPIAWLKAVAKNLLTDHYRRAANRHEITSANVAEGLEGTLVANDGALASDALASVQDALAALTPGQRAVILLRAVHDLDTHEMAELLGRSPQAIRSLRHKAVRRLSASRQEQLAANE